MADVLITGVNNSTKIEALIGLGISGLITTYIIQGVVNEAEMPVWAMWMLGLLLLTFFGLRLLDKLKFIVEAWVHLKKEETLHKMRIQEADIELRKLEVKLELAKLG
ncbi:MAG: hypothetical protein ACXACE_15860 [Candidatus Thorarchaeota archaeon]|jgi:hypothetical protein